MSDNNLQNEGIGAGLTKEEKKEQKRKEKEEKKEQKSWQRKRKRIRKHRWTQPEKRKLLKEAF